MTGDPPGPDVAAFDPALALSTLARHDVRFVIIGGVAGMLWGSPSVTYDLDICYARDPANLERLVAALRELEARLRGVAEDVPFRLDPQTIAAGDHFTFVTRAGNLDCFAVPAGSEGFEQLARTAVEMDLGDTRALVADLDGLMGMKRAAGRPKDRIELEVLGALREEIGRHERRE